MNRKYLAAAAGGAGAAAIGAGILVPALSGPAAATTNQAASAAAASASSLGSAPYLTLAAANKAVALAMNACLQKGYPVSVTIVDHDGVVIDQQRADTATGATVNVSLEKAVAAAGFQVPTSSMESAAATQPGYISIPGFSILPGGLPIKGAGKVIAGIGVSGAPTGQIDASCAAVAVAAIS
jgi:uncharacterized protein GlcG (DUF336 family)